MPHDPRKPPLASTNGEHSADCGELRATAEKRRYTAPGSWQEAFLEALGRTGTMRAAAEAVGIAPNTPLMAQRRDQDFADACTDALRVYRDRLVERACKRGLQKSDRLLSKAIDRYDRIIDGQAPRQLDPQGDRCLEPAMPQIILMVQTVLGQAPASQRRPVQGEVLPGDGPSMPSPNSAGEGTP